MTGFDPRRLGVYADADYSRAKGFQDFGLTYATPLPGEELPAGHQLRLEDFDYRRPGTGIPPNAVADLVGRILAQPLAAGQALQWTDLSPKDSG